MAPFTLAIFLGAFLLFLIQPLTGRFVLPWFGGAPAIWTVCLLFFQTALFFGYLYAHLIGKYFSAHRQITLHLGLLMGAVLWLPPIPTAPSPTTAASAPVAELITLLVSHIGPIFVLLSATGPLVQRWFHTAFPDRSPYTLYALSNLGSLSALLAYPFAFEPLITRSQQAWGWSVGFVGFIGICGWCAWHLRRQSTNNESPRQVSSEDSPRDVITWPQRILWLVWAAIGTGMLAATTALISTDVAPVPFLWIAPITIYLLSFVVTFSTRSCYHPTLFAGLMMLAAAIVLDLRSFGSRTGFEQFILTSLFSLGVACTICHAKLYRNRPKAEHLTDFYLTIAGGGALGTLWVAIVSPALFDLNFDLPLLWTALISVFVWQAFRQRNLAMGLALWIGQFFALIFAPLLRPTLEYSRWENLTGVIQQEPRVPFILVAGIVFWGANHFWWKSTNWRVSFTVLMLGLPLATTGYYLVSTLHTPPGSIEIRRGFYGSIAVIDYRDSEAAGSARFMSHGTTTHGMQLLDANYSAYPTSYYVPKSGIGQALSRANQTPNRNIGVVGLGVGTVSAYGMTGDRIRFFEIDQNVIDLAEKHFDYISQSEASVDIVLGDGRLMLQQEIQEALPRYDLLVLDAFSGDAVPVHLLTQEAFSVYLARLKTTGVIAINISNRIVDLRKAIEGNARQFDLSLVHASHFPSSEEWWKFSSQWLLLAPMRETLNDPTITEWSDIVAPSELQGPIWTDEFASILPILR